MVALENITELPFDDENASNFPSDRTRSVSTDFESMTTLNNDSDPSVGI
jgi:hypothetical protein